MHYVVQASKLTKIFLFRDKQKELMENPDLLLKDEPFSVTIPRSAGAIVLQHKVPMPVSSLLSNRIQIVDKKGNITESFTRETDPSEVVDLLPWLTGGDSGTQMRETDQFGVVELKMGQDYTSYLSEMMGMEAMAAMNPERKDDILKDRAKLQTFMQKQLTSSMADAIAQADSRVMRAIRTMFTYYWKQYQTNLEANAGKIIPTDAENLAAHILRNEIEKGQAKRSEMMRNMADLMNQQPVL